MFVSGRLLLFLLLNCLFINWSSCMLVDINGESVKTKDRRRRNLFPLLGYVQGYKIGQNWALQLPPFVLSPVIIVPPVNQQQNVNILKGSTDESFQENGGTIQTIMSANLILNSSLEDIVTNFKNSSVNDGVQSEKVVSLNDTLRQINEATDSSTENNIERGEQVSTTENFQATVTDELTTLKQNTSTTVAGVYPSAVYNNEIINTLRFTTPSPESILRVPATEDLWKDFYSEINNNNIKIDESQNIAAKIHKITASSRFSLHQSTTERYYLRPNTRYYSPWYSAQVDQFPIKSNSYREEGNESPLPLYSDDRWNRFSSLSKVVLPTSGFKPLAGLYYDGFLHKSLAKRNGFIPFNKHYY